MSEEFVVQTIRVLDDGGPAGGATFISNVELRENLTRELREDGTLELREGN